MLVYDSAFAVFCMKCWIVRVYEWALNNERQNQAKFTLPCMYKSFLIASINFTWVNFKHDMLNESHLLRCEKLFPRFIIVSPLREKLFSKESKKGVLDKPSSCIKMFPFGKNKQERRGKTALNGIVSESSLNIYQNKFTAKMFKRQARLA